MFSHPSEQLLAELRCHLRDHPDRLLGRQRRPPAFYDPHARLQRSKRWRVRVGPILVQRPLHLHRTSCGLVGLRAAQHAPAPDPFDVDHFTVDVCFLKLLTQDLPLDLHHPRVQTALEFLEIIPQRTPPALSHERHQTLHCPPCRGPQLLRPNNPNTTCLAHAALNATATALIPVHFASGMDLRR
jgi:hypothetical protein